MGTDCKVVEFRLWLKCQQIINILFGSADTTSGLTWNNFYTSREWISLVASATGTSRCMGMNVTFSIECTCTHAWITTFFVYTSFVTWTIRIDRTFGSTVWWTSNIICYTRANWLWFVSTTVRIRSTRIWVARIWIVIYDWWSWR